MPLKLLIAADADLRRALVEQLIQGKGFILAEAESAASALALMEAAPPDLLLICSALAGGSLLRRAREAGCSAPAILLAEAESAPQLAAQYDAVLTRPFRFARLMALLRALGPAATAAHEPGLPLTEKEAALLARLAGAGGEVVARETLLRDIWGYSPAVATHTLETHIHRLRRKLEQSPRRLMLQTAPGGYRLTTDVAATRSAARK